MKSFFPPALALLSSVSTRALDREFQLTSPRGAVIDVKAHSPENLLPNSELPVLVLAPGQSCNWKAELFEKIAAESVAAGFAVVRFNWAYCLEHPGDFTYSPNLTNEVEDLRTVLTHVRATGYTKPDSIFLGGKSLGSLVAHKVLVTEPALRGYIYLTPVVSDPEDANGQPLPTPRAVAAQNYPGLFQDPRPGLFALGNTDVLGHLPLLFQFLGSSTGNISVFVAGGGHGLALNGPSGQLDAEKTARNLSVVADAVVNWLKLQLQ